ncbi:superoxide dismutase [Deinococcus planocerae]|uniref:superoxide dismutase n=1 Tax=Deinococcus planocerae TaxID=1737569 RepID=UPI000C7F16CB|nr:superoxide dismutase [Deinococcus planocerae]
MKRLLVLALPLVVASCGALGVQTFTLGKQPAAGDLDPAGVVTARRSGDAVLTSAKVTGLRANQFYVAHYHLQGTASTDPCKSGGPPIMSSKIVGTTDGTGILTLNGSVPRADIAQATYFNIHTASDAQGTPADPGVACTAVTVP